MIEQYIKWYIVELPAEIAIKPKSIIELNDDIVVWLNENCKSGWSQGTVSSYISCDIWFENKEDAFACMLRWG